MQPLKSEIIRRIRGIKLFADSHDQGYCDDESAGNWTWLELAILNDDSSMESPKTTEDGVELVWVSHSNKLKSEDYEWLQGEYFEEGHDLLDLVEASSIYTINF